MKEGTRRVDRRRAGPALGPLCVMLFLSMPPAGAAGAARKGGGWTAGGSSRRNGMEEPGKQQQLRGRGGALRLEAFVANGALPKPDRHCNRQGPDYARRPHRMGGGAQSGQEALRRTRKRGRSCSGSSSSSSSSSNISISSSHSSSSGRRMVSRLAASVSAADGQHARAGGASSAFAVPLPDRQGLGVQSAAEPPNEDNTPVGDTAAAPSSLSLALHEAGEADAEADAESDAKSDECLVEARQEGRTAALGPHELDLPICLTPGERGLFKLLKTVVAEYNMGTTLRVAGGWVRDKLLAGSQCASPMKGVKHKVDIDISLDNCLGVDFADKINAYLRSQGQEEHTVGVVGKCPEKSKHLETATMNLGGFWCDFVNLRTESYTLESRIPHMGIGTPRQDAFRRDLTINALFYNIQTGYVEDWTGRGWDDLAQGLISTPLPPLETLLDDPLRVLRSIRFASRFDFDLSAELQEAAQDPRVHEALGRKISSERIGIEIDLMVRSRDPLRAFTLISEARLCPVIFTLPATTVQLSSLDSGGEGADALEPAACFEQGLVYLRNMHTLLLQAPGPSSQHVGSMEDDRNLALYAAFLLPFADTFYEPKRGKKLEPLTKYFIQERLKLRSRVAEQVHLIHEAALDFQVLLRQTTNGPVTTSNFHSVSRRLCRVRAGQVMRRVGVHWRTALVLGCTGHLGSKHILDEAMTSVRDEQDVEEEGAIIQAYIRMGNRMEEMGLVGVWDMGPIFDGRQLPDVLPGIKTGPMYREVIEKQIAFQLKHRHVTDDEMRRFLSETYFKMSSAVSG